MYAKLVTPEDSDWREALGRMRHDVYHTPEYVEHAGRHEGGRPCCAIVDSHDAVLLLPLLVRKLPEWYAGSSAACDASSPSGYPGPLMTSGVSAETATRLWSSLRATAAAHGIVTTFLRGHPLFSTPTAEGLPNFQSVYHGDTVYMDLTQSEERLSAQVRPSHRYEIRRLERMGFTVEMDAWQWYDRFMNLYRETMQRVAARSAYHYSDAYFNDLRELLGERLHLGCVVSPQGELAAAALFLETCGMVQYHLSATSEPFIKFSPAKLLLSEARDWARERGNRRLHLGGGVGARRDSLFQFKAGFSELRASFHTIQLVVNPARHDSLNRHWAAQHPTIDPDAQFFPRYRQAA